MEYAIILLVYYTLDSVTIVALGRTDAQTGRSSDIADFYIICIIIANKVNLYSITIWHMLKWPPHYLLLSFTHIKFHLPYPGHQLETESLLISHAGSTHSSQICIDC